MSQPSVCCRPKWQPEQHGEAITGYLNLLEHYEGTGGWKYQWTTVQNIANLLDALGEPDVAALLRNATSRPPVRSGSGDPGMAREPVIEQARQILETLVSTWPQGHHRETL